MKTWKILAIIQVAYSNNVINKFYTKESYHIVWDFQEKIAEFWTECQSSFSLLAKSYINMQTNLACTSKEQVFQEWTAFGNFLFSFFSNSIVISDLTALQRFLIEFYSFIFTPFCQWIFAKCQSRFNLFTSRRCWIRHISDCFLRRGK